MVKFEESKLIERFNNKVVTREELYNYYRKFEPDLNYYTFSWRLHDLKNKNILKPIKRNHYLISNKPFYEMRLDNITKEIANFISNEYDSVKISIWETSCLNEFSQHLMSNKITIIETEKDLLESIYFTLKDNEISNIFIEPDENIMNYYVSESQSPIILKRLLSRSPLQKLNGISSPSLEKILVDIISDKKLFYFIEGKESERILINAMEKYIVDTTTLLNYAERREKRKYIEQILYENNLLINSDTNI